MDDRENDPRVLNGIRPVIVALASLMFNLVPHGNFFFMDAEDNIVTAVFYCEETRDYLCVIYNEHGRYTHWTHVPAQDAIMN